MSGNFLADGNKTTEKKGGMKEKDKKKEGK
jgi:hypothetical protein